MKLNVIKSLNNALLLFKDLLQNNTTFNVKISKNGYMQKIYCVGEKDSKPAVVLVDLLSVSDICLLSILIASFKSCNKNILYSNSLDEKYIEELQCYLKNNNDILVSLKDDKIFLSSPLGDFLLLKISEDVVAREFLLKSLCMLFAACGKNVSNNIDSICLNDYGVL